MMDGHHHQGSFGSKGLRCTASVSGQRLVNPRCARVSRFGFWGSEPKRVWVWGFGFRVSGLSFLGFIVEHQKLFAVPDIFLGNFAIGCLRCVVPPAPKP